MIGTAVAIALFGPEMPAQAQQLEEVIVTGIRVSHQKSLESKRAANSVIEVVTAEDIGKMPDKNVADSLSRLPGVTVSSASANEGGFDENDRISMRGTNPSLTQTLINGHNVAAGDWFVLNQTSQVGRSVSYTLLPSELVDHIVVNKSSQASLVEGGVAGSVDIITRKPLDFSDQFTFGFSAGAVYSELPDETDPQLSALFNWKNDSNTVGVMIQAFSEERHLRRDGVEVLGYRTIAPGSAIATSNPDLSGVAYPHLIGAALFEQQRERTGGLVDIEFRPSDELRIDAQYFMSDLEATNYNRNFLFDNRGTIGEGAGFGPDPGYVVRNGTLVEANFTGPGTLSTGVYDQISRPNSKATSNYGSLGASYNFSDTFTLSGEIGTSEGHGETPTQDVNESVLPAGTGGGFRLNGTGNAPDFNFGTADTSTPTPGGITVPFGWIFGSQAVDVEDQEDWAEIDADFAMDGGALTNLRFGVRYSNHSRDSLHVVGQGPLFCDPPVPTVPPSQVPCATDFDYSEFQNYPTDFNTFGGSFPTNFWYLSPAQLAAYNSPDNVNRDPVARLEWPGMYQVEEKNAAAYAQLDFEGSSWSGNIGVRFVRTEENIVTNVPVTVDDSGNPFDPDAITGSAFGPFKQVPVEHTYDDWLPSANLRWEVTEDLVARFAAAMTMTRPDYSALAGVVNLGAPPATLDEIGGGSGGNPDLKPIRSTNFDAGLEWYFASNSLLGIGLFYMDLDNYVAFGTERKTYLTFSDEFPDGANLQYDLTVPVNAQGRVQGVELNYQQAINDNIGFAANYTYADGKQTSLVINNDDRLVGTSENTYNLSGYFENDSFNARVTYTYRSEFFSGLDRNTAFSQDDIASLAASLGYTFNENYTITLDGQNLNEPTLKYFALNEDQPRAFYKNGAQYYLSLRVKF
jgi:iron complex outermembrane recepter protein